MGGDAEKCVKKKKISKPYQRFKLSECSSFLPRTCMHGSCYGICRQVFLLSHIFPEHFNSSFCMQRLLLCSWNSGSIVYGHK